MNKKYNIIIVGAGSAGYSCAMRLAQFNLNVLLVANNDIGGTCLHRGCVPTKALIKIANTVQSIHSSSYYGIDSAFNNINQKSANRFKDNIINTMWNGLTTLLKGYKNIDIINGLANIIDNKSVVVNDIQYNADNLIIATGAVPVHIDNIDIDEKYIITSNTAINLNTSINSYAIVGGGTIGIEFGSMWNNLQKDVYIIEKSNSILPNEDNELSTYLYNRLESKGIKFYLDNSIESYKIINNKVSLTLQDKTSITVDKLLIAVGRRPNIPKNNLNLNIDKYSAIVVNENYQTNIPNVYAIGDVINKMQLAHNAFLEGRTLAEYLGNATKCNIDYKSIPKVTYSTPELASIGFTEKEAKQIYGKNIKTFNYNLSHNAKSLIDHDSGFVKIIENKDRVIGIHIISNIASELIAECQLVYNWEANSSDFDNIIHAHPTKSEIIHEAMMGLQGKNLHSYYKK